MRHGWFAIPGVQSGDRTVEQQLTGVAPALAEAKGKTVLDLGCAEGLISAAFARAGADSVFGIDAVKDHVEAACCHCGHHLPRFQHIGLDELARQETDAGEVWKYDIVLALGVCHKLRDPAVGVRFAARAAADLVLFRMHRISEKNGGELRSKYAKQNVCYVPQIVEPEGFKLERILPGPYEETVWWYRRNSS